MYPTNNEKRKEPFFPYKFCAFFSNNEIHGEQRNAILSF